MVEINFGPNSIQSGGTGIGEVNEYNIDWGNLEQEFAVLKRKTIEEKPQLTLAVEHLEAAVKGKDNSKIRKVIAKYATEFASATFSNLASAGILAVIKMFSP